jgi:tetratricopeptide (TPR) repeat protein
MSTVRPVSAFFGRAQELAKIDRRFAAGARAITLLGGPGVGKTRIAREWALRNARGAVFIELAGVRTVADAQSRIATALGVGEAALDDALARRGATFLILDECESLRGNIPIERWCAASTRILFTSRARLGFDGEAVIEIGPLDGGDAAALFRDRATRAGAVIEDRALVDTIVRELEGNALALELAAARMRIMSPEELLKRLGRHLEVLGGETLRSAINASFELLDAEEQSALAQLSVFAGAFTLDDAEAIVRVARPVVDVLATLRDHSLVRRDERGLSLFASVRAFAAERMDPAVRTRHAEHFAAHGLAMANRWNHQGDADALRALIAMRDDLSVALETNPSLVACAFALATAIAAHGPFNRELEVVEIGARAAAGMQGDLAAQMLAAHARARGIAGHVRESIDELRSLSAEDPLVMGEILVELGTRLRQAGEVDEATRVYRAAEELLRGNGTRVEAGALASLGRMETDAGNLSVGRELNVRARALARTLGDRMVLGWSSGNLAQLEQELGHHDDARARYDEAIGAFKSSGDPRYAAIYSGYRGDLDFELGDLDAAEKRYRAAIEDLERGRVPRGAGLFRAALGAVLSRRGERARAEEEFDRAELTLRGVHDPKALRVLQIHRGAELDDLTSIEIRFALRILRDRPRAPGKLIAFDDGRFTLPNGATLDLRNKHALRRILTALMEGTTSSNALIRAGWPKEKLEREAAATRLRVAIATLRKSGLREVLLTTEDGYRLVAELVVART